MILHVYYKIWVDCISKACSIPTNKNNWKGFTMIFMSMAMSLNFALFIAILQRNILGFSFYNININIFPGTKLDAFVCFFILFILPNILLNYFLIFRHDRYKMLLTKYKPNNGKLFICYFLTSLTLPLLLIVLGKLFL